MPPISELVNSPMKDKEWAKTEPLSILSHMAMPTPVAEAYRPSRGLRCPLPPLNPVNPDNIRQLNQPGVRSVRVIPPKFPVSE
jgi:hypothetical protein